MKPNFALTLSFEGIGLLHRAFPGWHSVGEVSLDTPDLAASLADLRDRAAKLDTHPIRTKLVIPNDQIRYLHFDADGLGPDEIADAVHRALDGATPYAVDDLAYDWSLGAGQVYVSAVARETLAEAEAFACEHGFDPLCFVAVPEGRDFVGEPWFGETGHAAEILPAGGHVERDTAAIRVIGTAPLPQATPEQEPEITPETEAAAEEAPLHDSETGDTARSESKTEAEPETAAETTAAAEPAPEAPETAEDTALEETEAEETGASASAPAAAEDPGEQAKDTPPPASETPAAAPVSFSSIRARRDELPAAATRLSGATRDSRASERAPDPADADATRAEPPLAAAAPPPPDRADQVTGTPQNALSEDAAARIGASLRPTDADRMTAAPEGADPDTDAPGDIPPPPPFMADRLQAEAEDLPDDALRDSAPAPEPAARAPSFFTRRKRGKRRLSLRPAGSDGAAPLTSREAEKQRMTVFGARKPAPVGGKPRFLGLILTAVLLIFLVGVAAWASIFLEDGLARWFRDGPRETSTEIASTPPLDAPALARPAGQAAGDTGMTGDTEMAGGTETADEPEMTGDTETSEAVEQAETVIAALSGVTSDIEETPREARPDPVPAELTEQEARTRYAVTGIWQRAPDAPSEPGQQTLEDFYQTSIDPKVLEQDAIALPDSRSLLGDARPDTPADPPAASTTFRLDPRGLVRATPEGALTPEGIQVFAGRPALTPPPRPAETLAQPAEDAETAAQSAAETERLAALRPRVRPEDLSETNERETLGGRTRGELASIRPKLRPQSAQELAEQAAAASTAAVSPDPDAVDAALEEAVAARTADPLAGATAQAVKVSVKPKPRPRNFDRIVSRSQQQAEEEATQTAAVAVPRAQRATPSGPTPTTVARAATEKNAIKLKRVNLIGVYGSESNRRALVRLANGRYKKVKVGDRLDGGRVAAIGTSELRYVKSGRSVTLKMPRG